MAACLALRSTSQPAPQISQCLTCYGSETLAGTPPMIQIVSTIGLRDYTHLHPVAEHPFKNQPAPASMRPQGVGIHASKDGIVGLNPSFNRLRVRQCPFSQHRRCRDSHNQITGNTERNEGGSSKLGGGLWTGIIIPGGEWSPGRNNVTIFTKAELLSHML